MSDTEPQPDPIAALLAAQQQWSAIIEDQAQRVARLRQRTAADARAIGERLLAGQSAEDIIQGYHEYLAHEFGGGEPEDARSLDPFPEGASGDRPPVDP